MQLAKLAGARVIATTRHDGKAATLRELGADAVVVTADDGRSASRTCAKLTGGEGVDHAVDYTGNPELLRFHHERDAARRHASSSPASRAASRCRSPPPT